MLRDTERMRRRIWGEHEKHKRVGRRCVGVKLSDMR